jgi:hypothetical protein
MEVGWLFLVAAAIEHTVNYQGLIAFFRHPAETKEDVVL